VKRVLGGLLVAAIVLGALLTSRLLPRWRRAREVVAPELMSPILALPLSVTSPRVLRIVRGLPEPRTVPPGVGHDMRTATVGDRDPVPVHVYDPPGRRRFSGALYWIHGGGFVLGTPAIAHQFCARVATELGVLVVSVDYRLAPEHPFPAPLEDCYTGLRWVGDRADELAVDPARIAIGGDSAGGGLAASLAQLAHDRGEVPVCFQLLVYPMLDDRTVLREDHNGTGEFSWNPPSNRFGWTSYLGGPPIVDSAPPYAAAARRVDLAGLPAAWIGVGDLDLFRDEDLTYAERLRAAGVDVDLVVVPGMYHGADVFPAVWKAPSMVAFNRSKVEALRSAIG
jgi:acetyl esterase/lipase